MIQFRPADAPTAIARAMLLLIHSLFALVAFALCLGACAKPHATPAALRDDQRATLAFVRLVNGPTSGKGEPDQRRAMFEGHMANIQRLADAGVIIIAGPFEKPADRTWRGLFVMDVATEHEARAHCATDPGVAAGEFTPAISMIRADRTLREALALEKARIERPMSGGGASSQPVSQSAPKDASPGMHRYALVTAHDAAFAREWLAKARARVVWRADAATSREGVFAVDADPTVLRERLEREHEAHPSNGQRPLHPIASIDAWWGASSLLNLPASAGD
jgi:uncharacterized protein YciI